MAGLQAPLIVVQGASAAALPEVRPAAWPRGVRGAAQEGQNRRWRAACAGGSALALSAALSSRERRGLRRLPRPSTTLDAPPAPADAPPAPAAPPAVPKGRAVPVASPSRPGAKGEVDFPQHLRQQLVKKGLQSGKLFKGELRMARNTRFLAFVKTDKGVEILVRGSKALNRAMEGDTVVVEMLDAQKAAEYEATTKNSRHGLADGSRLSEEEQVQKVAELGEQGGETPGRVVAILKRNRRLLPGTVQPLDASEKLGVELKPSERLFFPADDRYPYVVVRPTEQSKDFSQLENSRVVISVDVWDRFSEFPKGRWNRTIGPIGDIAVETEMILLENDVRLNQFDEDILKCLPPDDYKIPEEEIAKRRDFRNITVCSIDPPGCEDVDDALSCEVLENGNFRVGVHIADVSHFLKPHTAMDEEAKLRCESVYMVDRRIDMLPRLLTTDVCSLRDDGKDRLTFSCVFELTPEGGIASSEFCKGVIRSAGALSYKEAQERLESDESEDTSAITQSIRHLYALSRHLRTKREKKGALNMEAIDLSFELDEATGIPIAMKEYKKYDTSTLIEEFMLLANGTAARRVAKHYKNNAVLRKHEPPKKEKMNALAQILSSKNIQGLKWGSNKELKKSLGQVIKNDDPFFNRLVFSMTVRCMMEAEYFTTSSEPRMEHWAHYGLAMPRYTHFTSPIRRYCDVLVHRQLAASLGIEELTGTLTQTMYTQIQVTKLNEKHKSAQSASRASNDLHTFLFFKAKGSVEAVGVVTVINRQGIRVTVEEYGAEGRADMSNSDWVIVEDKMMACGRPLSPFAGVTFGVLDRVVVRVEADCEDGKHRQLKLTFIRIATAEDVQAVS